MYYTLFLILQGQQCWSCTCSWEKSSPDLFLKFNTPMDCRRHGNARAHACDDSRLNKDSFVQHRVSPLLSSTTKRRPRTRHPRLHTRGSCKAINGPHCHSFRSTNQRRKDRIFLWLYFTSLAPNSPLCSLLKEKVSDISCYGCNISNKKAFNNIKVYSPSPHRLIVLQRK